MPRITVDITNEQFVALARLNAASNLHAQRINPGERPHTVEMTAAVAITYGLEQPHRIWAGSEFPEVHPTDDSTTTNYGAIPDYKQLSCGCCAGKKLSAGINWRLADDQCVCWNHQDVRIGRPVHVCSHHLTVAAVWAAPPQSAASDEVGR